MSGGDRLAAAQRRLRASLPRAVLADLERPDARRVARDLALDWGGVVTMLALAAAWPHALAWAIAFVGVGVCQYRLFVLGHDGLHGCLHADRAVNDALARWLVYAPLLTGFEDSRSNHLAHHDRLGQADDPERYVYALADKNSRLRLLLLCAGVLTFARTLERVVPYRGLRSGRALGLVLRQRLPVLLAQVVLVGAMLALGLPAWAWLVLWVAPIFVFVYLPDEVRSFCDHAVLSLPDDAADDRRLVSYAPDLLERVLLAPHAVNFQAEHHALPAVPYHHLAQAAALLAHTPEVDRRGRYVTFLRAAFRALPVRG